MMGKRITTIALATLTVTCVLCFETKSSARPLNPEYDGEIEINTVAPAANDITFIPEKDNIIPFPSSCEWASLYECWDRPNLTIKHDTVSEQKVLQNLSKFKGPSLGR